MITPGHEQERGSRTIESGPRLARQATAVTSGDGQRIEMIQATYRLLAVAVFCAMASAWWASRSLPVVHFLMTGPGLIMSLLAINAVPVLARRMLGSNPMAGTLVLALDGLLSGIALAPLVMLALMVSGSGEQAPNLVQSALVITGFAFLGVTFYVHTTKVNFHWGGGIFAGLFFTALGLLTVNFFFPTNAFSYLLLGVVGILGVVQLLYGTSKVLNDPDFNDPISGALILYASVFNLFQVILSLLLNTRSRD